MTGRPLSVLVFSQYFWPETFRINDFAVELRDAGAHVTVLTGQPNYPDGEIARGYSAWGCGAEEYRGLTVYRVPLFPRGRNSALRLALNYLSFIVSAAVCGTWLLRGRRFDVVFVYAPSPILQAIPAAWIAWLKGARLVTWVQDLWPESLEATGFVRNPRLLGLVGHVVDWIYGRHDMLLVQSPGFIAPVRQRAPRKPVHYLPNPGDRSFDATVGLDSVALRLADGFNVVFAGNLGTAQALETIVAAAQLLQDDPSIRFVLVGSGSRDGWLRDEIERLGLTNIQTPGRFSSEEMAGILRQASVLLVTLARNPIFALTVPSKVQAYLAAGRPVVASIDGEGARVVQDADAGLAVPAEDPVGLAAAIRRLRALDAHELECMGRRGRVYYEREFAPQMLADRALELLRASAQR